MADELTRSEGRELLRAMTADIVKLKSQTAVYHYRMGVKLQAVQDRELWRFGDYGSFSDYCRSGADVSRSTVYRSLRLVRHFNEEIAARFGAEKLHALVRWVEATPAVELPGDVLAARLRLRGDDGRFYQLPVTEAAAWQIDEAIGLLEEAKRGGTKVERDVQQVADALNALFPGRRKPVKVAQGPKGEPVLSISKVPFSQLPILLAGLQEHTTR